MNKTICKLNKLNIDPCVYFLGSDEEIEAAEALEASRAADLEKILFNNAMVLYRTEAGQTRYLHRSTRAGVAYQLSYEGSNGLPVMHENFIQTSENHIDAWIGSKTDLLKHYIDESLNNDLILEIYN